MSKRSRARNRQSWSDGPGTRVRKDPWRAMVDRARQAPIPHSAMVLMEALESEHRDNIKLPKLMRGYGGRRHWVDKNGVVHKCRPGLAELGGQARSTAIKNVRLLEQHRILRRVCEGPPGRPLGHLVEKYCGRGGRLPAIRRVDRQERSHLIGNGGCKTGGIGLANHYLPFEVDQAPAPLPPQDPADAPASAEALERFRQAKEQLPRARGPGP